MKKVNIKKYLDLHFKEVSEPLQIGIYQYTTRMDHSRKKYRCKNIEKRNLNTLFEKLFIQEEHKILYRIFGIKPFQQNVKILFDDLPSPNENGEIHGIILEKVKGFKFISSINKIEIQSILLSNGEHVEEQCEMQIDIISVDNFKCNIVCQVQMKINEDMSTWEIMESTDSSLIGEIYGIKFETEYQLWVEYLLISYIFFEIENERMAFFVAFAALDQFIESLYMRLPLIYQDAYFEKIDTLTEAEAEFLENQRKRYTNVNRRLVEEKLHDILVERFDDASKYAQPYTVINSYEKIRNKIAHCEAIDVRGKYLNLLLNIIKIIYLDGLGIDVTEIFIEKD